MQCHSCKADCEWKTVRGGRADAPGTHSDVSFRLDQKAANFKVATGSRRNQWSPSTEETQQNELAQTELCFIKNNNDDKEGQLLPDMRLHISVALDQKTANFKVALFSRLVQWSACPEQKKN